MTIDETKKVIQKIKTFRPFFQTGNSSSEEINFRKEWHRVLGSYDYEDVDRKLNEYFKDGDNVGRIPDVYYLVRYLKSSTDKRQSDGIWIRCNLCGEEIADKHFDRHFDRCSSVNYIYKKTQEIFNQKIDKSKLFKMTQEEFDRRYLCFLQQVKEKTTDEEEKNRVEKIIRMLNGEKVNLTLEEMM